MPSNTTYLQKNWYWPDFSRFGFDLNPKDVAMGWDNETAGGVYDVPTAPTVGFKPGYYPWTNWLDKIQKDYRFANVSDENAGCNLFPEVQDPWMFTEYVYEGENKKNADDTLPNPIGIVEPPLVNPAKITRTFDTNTGAISTSVLAYLGDPESGTTFVPAELRYAFELEPRWKSKMADPVTGATASYWESELDAIGWVETLSGGLQNSAFERTDEMRRRIRFTHPSNNAGVRLNRAQVWSHATRWGQSQNVPERVLNLTGPPDWFRLKGRATGRIVPHINIIQGQPVYDVCSSPMPQAAIRYEGITLNTWNWGGGQNIGLTAVTPNGPNGQADAVFTYAIPANNTNAVLEPLPVKSWGTEPRYQWKALTHTNGDLIHRGCAFWHGLNGQVSCDYAKQINYVRAEAIVPVAAVYTLSRPASKIDEDVVIGFASTSTGPWLNNPLGSTLTHQLAIDGSIVGFTITGSTAPMTYMRVQIVAKDRPIPHNMLCGSYDFTQGATDQKSSYRSRCQVMGAKACPFYTAQGAQIVATFEAQASNGAEWANLQRGLPANYRLFGSQTQMGNAIAGFAPAFGGLGPTGLVGAGIAAFMIAAQHTPDPYTSGVPKEQRQTTEITFEPEVVAVDGKQQYYDTPDGKAPQADPESAIRLKAGTGYHVIDWKEDESFGGVDTTFFGMVNQVNYRILHPIQHCYVQAKCDAIILGSKISMGYRRGSYANINFTTHALRMPGAPAYDESANYCRYGNHRCPKTNLDRRAFEYAHNYQILVDEILLPFRGAGVAAFSGTLQQVFVVNGQVVTNINASNFSTYPNIMCAAATVDDSAPMVLGHYQPVIADSSGTQWRIYFFYDRPSWDPLHSRSHVTAHLVQFTGDDQPAYMTIIDTADRTIAQTMYGNADKVPWLVEIHSDYVMPVGNVLFATNPNPMSGGRNPEYRDNSLRGRQIICQSAPNTDDFGAYGRTATNQFGGPLSNRVPAGQTSRMGYWTEKYGFHILEARPLWDQTAYPTLPLQPSIGNNTAQPFVDVESRIVNKPQIVKGATPIHGVPSIATFDTDTGGSKMSNYASSGHVYTSDTSALLAWFRELVPSTDDNGNPIMATRWSTFLPEDENGKKIQCSPPSCPSDMLPLNRFYYRCSKCKIELTQEEINFYTQSVSTGQAAPSTLVPMPTTPPEGAVCGCPRICGGVMIKVGGMDHFLDSRSKGEIDVWAPPGTTVRRDGFFWKNPTLVSRAHYDQFLKKLGGYHPVPAQPGVSAGYQTPYLGPYSNVMGGMPRTMYQFYNPGLSHQLTAPFAATGQTVAQVRGTVRDIFAIYDTDTAKRYVGTTGQTTDIPFASEATTVLTKGDVLTFYRTEDPALPARIVGIPIQVTVGVPASISSEQVVVNDPPKPTRNQYADGDMGDRLFESAIRQWRFGIAKDSMYLWGSAANVGMPKNALADQVSQMGGPAAIADDFDPNTNVTKPLDERIIGPYASGPNAQYGGGLKMITVPQLKKLRNRVVPMLGYDLSDDGYSAAGDYSNWAQNSNLDRFGSNKKTTLGKFPIKQWGTIPPQVLAATSTGWDYYVEWPTGGIIEDTARAYYPVGTTWWRLNQTVGQIKRSGGTNPLHLDDASDAAKAKNPDGSPSAIIPYTGDTITSVCAFFLHGRIPMHMEVVKAYCIFTAGSGPSVGPIGCQGQYTGFTATMYPDGPNWDAKVYTGNQYCYWQHFHPWTQEPQHEDINNSGCVPGGFGYWSAKARQHTITYAQYNPTLDMLGGPAGEALPPDLLPQLASQPGVTTGYVSFMGIDAQTNYLDMVDVLTVSCNDTSWGFDFSQPYFEAWDWGQELQQKLTEHQIWKDMSYADYDTVRNRFHTIGKAAVGGNEEAITFDYYTEEYRNIIWPREHQGIAGWMNFTNYSTSPNFGKYIGITEKVSDTSWATGPQTIVQAASDGGNGAGNAGSIQRVLDITNTVKNLYNDRVTRYFDCKLGWSFTDLKTQIPALTDTNNGPAKRFHTGWRDPEYYVNYRYVDTALGMWLNDQWHHTPLSGDNTIAPNTDGDPIQFTDDTRMSRVDQVTRWDTQGLDSSNANYLQYHPWSLCHASQDLTEGGPIITPAPQEDATRFWRSTTDRADSQFFELDLRSTPLETSRRPWRYQQPQIDSTNATCPNVAKCVIAQRGWTVGQYAERATATWGTNSIPSTSSDHCANCGTLLQGVTYIGGDNITTVTYDTLFEGNPLVSNLQIGCDDGTGTPPRHGFVVEYFNTIAQTWRTLMIVDFDPVTSKYQYPQWNGSAWTQVETYTLPATFKGVEGIAGIPKNAAGSSGAHFCVVAAAKVRFNVMRPAAVSKSYPAAGAWGGCTPSNSTASVTVAALDGTASDYVHRTIILKDTATNTTRSVLISDVVAATGGYSLKLTSPPSTTETQFSIQWTSYVALCSKFRVYGWPYRTGDLFITPPAFVQPIYFGTGNTKFRLNAWATKVLSATATVGDRPGLPLTRVSSLSDPSFLWTVQQVTWGGFSFLEISAGSYYFDYQTNSIVVPAEYVDPTTNERHSIWDLNSTLYDNPNVNFAVLTLPRALTIEYLIGNGVAVEVPVVGHGVGPSYQLDRECVSFIARHGTDNEQVPGDVLSEPANVLPDMGYSEKIATNDNQPYKLFWQTYNHEPLIWNRAVGWLVGDELGAGQWSDDTVLGLFSGGHGRDISDCGPSAVIGGAAQGKVTLYGMPDTILAGKLAVYAKAYTTRTYNQAGTTVTTAERTGGYRSGAFVFRLQVNENVSNGRKSLSCGVPRILVYLRERSLDPSSETPLGSS